MKKWIILLLVIFSIPVVSGCFCQTVRETLVFAEKQYDAGKFSPALKEYQRVLFFYDKPEHAFLYAKIGDCYHNLGNHESAVEYYDFAISLSETDSLKYEYVFQKAFVFIEQENYPFALLEYQSLPDSLNEYFQNKKCFYRSVCFFGMQQYEKSETCLLKILDSNDTEDKDAIIRLFSEIRKLNRLNSGKIMIMSAVLPGSGQIYAGDIKNGLNSLLLCATLAGLGYYIAETYSLLEAVIAVFPMFQRYYTGGIINARDIAEKKQQRKRNEKFTEALEIIK